MGTKMTFPEGKSMYQKGDFLREVQSKVDPYRSEWERDLSRLKHSTAFRRLSGKTQLLPGRDSDFFRNRLTHSIEVSQIAKSIAHRINIQNGCYEQRDLNNGIPAHSFAISLPIVEFAGLAHDIGHPPFGHVGELALDKVMGTDAGGFEGNAQTLRILSRLEKKNKAHWETFGIENLEDKRVGLMLTYRSLASILKYDCCIPLVNGQRQHPSLSKYYKPATKLLKGYYLSEKPLVDKIKKAVLGLKKVPTDFAFKTVECSIMDIADDIAYSTYDLEDSIKAGFINMFDLLFLHTERSWIEDIAIEVFGPEDKDGQCKVEDHMREMIVGLPYPIGDEPMTSDEAVYDLTHLSYRSAKEFVQNGYLRSDFTSNLVKMFIDGVVFEPNIDYPCLSKVSLRKDVYEKVEILKSFTYNSLVKSSRIQMVEYRAEDIIGTMYDVLIKTKGKLLPMDYKFIWDQSATDEVRKRTVCDFIAGMTDRYALEFYARIKGVEPETIFKPTH